ncbi:DUF4190 domain-containing protein [Micromonospora yasonensis]|uniref:DUF4190 domain-containing protein n=1 Tax=Micromonospora yasonensis TaxID=1128667 RepID=UPI002231B74F|nr:DUF4190 domain-containing protein [Micromonospora yasonensis]MCW3842090.1 DUF4190 domain-containing protein [Micromonospora yasonensis]
MSYPPPSGGWHDPSAPGPQSGPPADPTLPMGGNPIPTQPTPADPYAGMPSAGDPYAAPGYPAGNPYPAGGYPPPAYPAYAAPSTKTNGLAIVALVLALVGFTSCITAPIGAILGHVARKQIRETGEQGDGMAKAGIIIGWILTGLMVVLIAVYIVVIVIAINSDTGGSTATF